MPKIYKLWVIRRDSGINLVDATFEEFKQGKFVDGLLMSGLISSFLMFSNEILGEGIRLIETPNYRLLFNLQDDLIVVLMMDSGGRVHFAEKILQIKPDKKNIPKLQESIDICHLNITFWILNL